MEHIIEIEHLTKDYGQGRGVFDVSFYVDRGECFGFLGPNGAGKSTTIRHLMGFSVPDSGTTRLNGISSLKERDLIMEGVSYIPGEVALPLNLKGTDVIKEQVSLKHMKDLSLLQELIKYFELDPTLYCKEMSLGMKRKMAIVCAFMSNPEIIIMDEPSSGLDPEMQEKFVEYVKKEKKAGKTILLSSHIFSEVDSCCDRIAVIKDGHIVSQFIADDLKHKSTKRYRLEYQNVSLADSAMSQMLKEGYKVTLSPSDKKRLHVTCDDKEISGMLSNIPQEGLIDLFEKKETLEDYFMSFYKEDKTYGGISK